MRKPYSVLFRPYYTITYHTILYHTYNNELYFKVVLQMRKIRFGPLLREQKSGLKLKWILQMSVETYAKGIQNVKLGTWRKGPVISCLK